MAEQSFKYAVVGGGLAGASAVEGIRELDRDGPIVLICGERHLPYNRPPLSKMLWMGGMEVDEIFVQEKDYYIKNGVTLVLGTKVTGLDAGAKELTDDKGKTYGYEKLLLATGSAPRTLNIPGGGLAGISYFRGLDDYSEIRAKASEGKAAVVIGGGFIGSEMAAALNLNKLHVTMMFPSSYICHRVFPDYLGREIQTRYVEKGVNVLSGETPVSISRDGEGYITTTSKGREMESDIIIVGVGVQPNIELAAKAGLAIADGIEVDEYLRTGDPDIYAAGDNVFYPSKALGHRMRLEHWDNARSQGKHAGRNMAGAGEPFTYLPFFFSDLFEFSYEAVGDVDANLNTFADWQVENETGVIYYLLENKVKGAMMCNMPDLVDQARELIIRDEKVDPKGLKGAVK